MPNIQATPAGLYYNIILFAILAVSFVFTKTAVETWEHADKWKSILLLMFSFWVPMFWLTKVVFIVN